MNASAITNGLVPDYNYPGGDRIWTNGGLTRQTQNEYLFHGIL